MASSSVMRKQFEEVTAPGYFRNSLKEFMNVGINQNWQKLTEKLPHLKKP